MQCALPNTALQARPMRQLCVHGLHEWADGVNATSAAVYVQPRSQFPVSRS